MTEAEMRELEELEELELLEQQEQEKVQAAQVEPTTMEAISTGFIEGVPFMKDAIAGVEAIQERVTSEDPLDIDKFVDQYQDNRADIDRTINLSEELAPKATFAGDVIGGIASGAGRSLAASALEGAASGLSRSEDRSAADAIVGLGSGMLGHGIGSVVGKGIKKVGKQVGGLLQDKADEALSAALGSDRSFGAARIHKHLKVSRQTGKEFLDNVKGLGIVEAGDDLPRILDKTSKVKQELGRELGSFYKQVDDELKPEIDINSVKSRINDDVISDFVNSDDPGMQQIGAELGEYVAKIGKKPGKVSSVLKPSGAVNPDGSPIMVKEITEEVIDDSQWSMSRLHNLQKDIRSRIAAIYKSNGMDKTAAKEQQRKVAASIGTVMDDTLDEISTPDNLVYQLNKDLRRKFGNVSTVEEILDNRLGKTKADPMLELKQMMGFRSMLLTSVGAGVGGPVGAGIGFGLNAIINNPKTPTYIAAGLPKIAQMIAKNPGGDMATRIIAASSQSSKKFNTAVAGTIAEMNLMVQPISRNMEQAKDSYDDIEKLLEHNLPSVAKQFREIRDGGDDDAMASFLDGISKNPEAQRFFESGVGFDGKVYSVEDKAIFDKQVRGSQVSGTQKMQLLKDLHGNGTIPDMEAVPARQPNRYTPRKKDDISY